MHLGHAYSACLAHDLASAAGGQFELRIEDIDQTRARPQWEAQIYDDLTWLGLSWSTPVLRQSERLQEYQAALARLAQMGVLYACYCTRRDIVDATAAPQEGVGPKYGPDGLIYPGTCRHLPRRDHTDDAPALRLDMQKAIALLTSRDTAWPLVFCETGEGEAQTVRLTADAALHELGDIVLARRDMGTSYHLSVVVDDAAQEISHVVRGVDLFDATKIHVVLQKLLALPTPVYHHHRLIRDANGKRLAKRDDARAIALYRANGLTPHEVRALVGL